MRTHLIRPSLPPIRKRDRFAGRSLRRPTDKPILFLDVDGVLNTRTSLLCGQELDPACVKRLKRIIAEGDPLVVLSSTWRLMADKRAEVQRAAGIRIMPCTPSLQGSRGTEIRAFLTGSRTAPPPGYVILDDDDDMLPEQLPFFVQTTSADGLTDAIADDVIARLLSYKSKS